jgi:uncharacterized protein YodC (DUF2158 family)
MAKQVLKMLAWTVRIAAALAIAASAIPQPGLAKSLAANAGTKMASGKVHKASRFQQGELVRLRSGGPLMTVKGVQGDGVICTWATEYGQFSTETFPGTALVAVGGPGGPALPSTIESYTYHPCPASVEVNGRNECL